MRHTKTASTYADVKMVHINFILLITNNNNNKMMEFLYVRAFFFVWIDISFCFCL